MVRAWFIFFIIFIGIIFNCYIGIFSSRINSISKDGSGENPVIICLCYFINIFFISIIVFFSLLNIFFIIIYSTVNFSLRWIT